MTCVVALLSIQESKNKISVYVYVTMYVSIDSKISITFLLHQTFWHISSKSSPVGAKFVTHLS